MNAVLVIESICTFLKVRQVPVQHSRLFLHIPRKRHLMEITLDGPNVSIVVYGDGALTEGDIARKFTKLATSNLNTNPMRRIEDAQFLLAEQGCLQKIYEYVMSKKRK